MEDQWNVNEESMEANGTSTSDQSMMCQWKVEGWSMRGQCGVSDRSMGINVGSMRCGVNGGSMRGQWGVNGESMGSQWGSMEGQ